jgi:DNA polymerase sigma
LKDNLSQLKCNISVRNPVTDHSIKLLKAYSLIDDRVALLMSFLKEWTKGRCIKSCSEGYLSEYGYFLCLINYLQNCALPILPSLQKLSKSWDGASFSIDRDIEPEYMINPLGNDVVNSHFYPVDILANVEKLRSVASRNKDSVVSLLFGFFKFFGSEFDYRLSVVSIRETKTVLKIDKAEEDGWLSNDRISIEDPFETSHDVAFNVKASQMIHIRKEMLRAYNILKKGDPALLELLLSAEEN